MGKLASSDTDTLLDKRRPSNSEALLESPDSHGGTVSAIHLPTRRAKRNLTTFIWAFRTTFLKDKRIGEQLDASDKRKLIEAITEAAELVNGDISRTVTKEMFENKQRELNEIVESIKSKFNGVGSQCAPDGDRGAELNTDNLLMHLEHEIASMATQLPDPGLANLHSNRKSSLIEMLRSVWEFKFRSTIKQKPTVETPLLGSTSSCNTDSIESNNNTSTTSINIDNSICRLIHTALKPIGSPSFALLDYTLWVILNFITIFLFPYIKPPSSSISTSKLPVITPADRMVSITPTGCVILSHFAFYIVSWILRTALAYDVSYRTVVIQTIYDKQPETNFPESDHWQLIPMSAVRYLSIEEG